LVPRIDWFFSQATVVSTRLADVAFATPFLMLGAIETNAAQEGKNNLGLASASDLGLASASG